LALGAIFFVTIIVAAFPPSAFALDEEFTSRKLTLVAGTDGGSKAGGSVSHKFDFITGAGGAAESVGSIKFEYCTLARGTCTMPSGLVTTSATLNATQVGATGFTMVNTTNGAPYITRSAANINPGTTLGYQLDLVTNPSAVNTTFFVRISYYTATNATGTVLDHGVVAASTADPIVLTGTMPESLVFCTGIRVNVPCTSTTSAANITFDDLFSPTITRYATAEMAASTNAGSGYVITMNGTTMTSGSNTITAMGSATTSVIGTSQFGSNLMLNTAAASFTSGSPITFTGPGTVTNVASNINVTGTGTAFLSTFDVGEILTFTSGPAESCTIATITSNTALTCSSTVTNAHTTATYTVTPASGATFGKTVFPATNSGLQLKGQPKTGYDTAETYKFTTGDTVAASDASGAGPTNSQEYRMSYIVNVNPAQPAGTYSTTLTYICTATF
jgi:hypothetical protein